MTFHFLFFFRNQFVFHLSLPLVARALTTGGGLASRTQRETERRGKRETQTDSGHPSPASERSGHTHLALLFGLQSQVGEGLTWGKEHWRGVHWETPSFSPDKDHTLENNP